MSDQSDPLEWRETALGAVPVSSRFDDPFYSLAGGLDETRHVFLAGNDLPARFAGGFHIAELGFGTGLNLFTAILAWRKAGLDGTLHFTSFEAFPMSATDMAAAHAAFPEIAPLTGPFLSQWILGRRSFEVAPNVRLNVILGDVQATLPDWTGQADAWFLDGFSPAKNPQMWSAEVLAAVGAHTRPGGTAATYTAAGHVRRALQDAGFEVERTPGYGSKRHMTRARMPR